MIFGLGGQIHGAPNDRRDSREMPGKIGDPVEVAEVISVVLTNKWMTGQVIGVDGGLATVKPR